MIKGEANHVLAFPLVMFGGQKNHNTYECVYFISKCIFPTNFCR